MADVVRWPDPHCIRCWYVFDGEHPWGVMAIGKVLGPYCDVCAKQVAESSQAYQELIDKATSRVC